MACLVLCVSLACVSHRICLALSRFSGIILNHLAGRGRKANTHRTRLPSVRGGQRIALALIANRDFQIYRKSASFFFAVSSVSEAELAPVAAYQHHVLPGPSVLTPPANSPVTSGLWYLGVLHIARASFSLACAASREKGTTGTPLRAFGFGSFVLCFFLAATVVPSVRL